MHELSHFLAESVRRFSESYLIRVLAFLPLDCRRPCRNVGAAKRLSKPPMLLYRLLNAKALSSLFWRIIIYHVVVGFFLRCKDVCVY